jgi:hypothetical protein
MQTDVYFQQDQHSVIRLGVQDSRITAKFDRSITYCNRSYIAALTALFQIRTTVCMGSVAVTGIEQGINMVHFRLSDLSHSSPIVFLLSTHLQSLL